MYISDLITVSGYLHTAGFKTAEELILPSVYTNLLDIEQALKLRKTTKRHTKFVPREPISLRISLVQG